MKKYTIFYIFLITVLCLTFYFNIKYSCESFTNFTPKQNLDINLIAITYETDTNNNEVNNLTKLFEKNNYKYKVLGNGDVWNGWYGRSQAYINYINTLDADTYVILCDGRDVLVNQPSNIFLQTALKIRKTHGNKVIVGTEKGCCTGNLDNIYRANNIPNNITNFQELYMEQQRQNSAKYNDYKFDYINFGLMFGKVDEFKKLFNILDVQPDQDDQALLHKIYYENPDILYLDHNQELFSNSSYNFNRFDKPGDEMCYFHWDNDLKVVKNTITNTVPCIIHIPAKNWDCYNKLINKLL